MRADRDKRASILTAEGQRQSAILTAEGNKQSAILNAEGNRESQILYAQGERESAILRAQGEGQAIQTVFQAIHDGNPDQSLLAYQYLQMMPKIAEGSANKLWIVPSEIGKALEGLGVDHDRPGRHPAALGRLEDPRRHGQHRARGDRRQRRPRRLGAQEGQCRRRGRDRRGGPGRQPARRRCSGDRAAAETDPSIDPDEVPPAPPEEPPTS